MATPGGPSIRAFLMSLGVAFVVLSVLADSGATTQRVVTGSVLEYQAGTWLSVINDGTNPWGLRIILRETTEYEGDTPGTEFDLAAITPGDRVTVWYTSNSSDRSQTANRVRMLGNTAP